MLKIKNLVKTLGVSKDVIDLTKSVHAPKNFNNVKQNIPII